ncbi:MAG: hypothetical protein HDS68_10545 [Bacteroidales bacterium]|nr:hypothetical protein [Bacteroidales bacterium]
MKSSRHNSGRRGLWVGYAMAAGIVFASLFGASNAQGTMQTDRKVPRTLRQPDTVAIRPTIPTANRYMNDRVFLERANELRAVEGHDYQIVVGDVEFRRADMYMFCDSAHFYDNPGSLQAFGNVRMEQGDTLFVFADQLDYSDSTQLAILYADPGKKVRLINRDVTLETDIFNYDMEIDLGYYEVGGVLTDRDNRLDSRYGEYSPTTKDALFRENVRLTSLSDNDTLEIYTDDMLYNTFTHIAILDTTSTIIASEGIIYTDRGVYNTETSQADLYRRSTVVASNGNTLTGDTLYYDKNLGFGEAFGNIELTDTASKVMLCGNYGYYFEVADSAMVTGRALAKEFSTSGDTLYLHADTIRTLLSIIPAMAVNDSVTIPADTTHHIIAAPHVRFYRSDLQGLCDSMTFVQRDSMMYMHYHPVVWNENKQIFGNVIQVHMNDSTADWAKFPEFAFMAEWVDEEFYNQLTGKEMDAFFENGALKHLDISGNVEAVFLPEEADSTYNKIANLQCSFMSVDFVNQTIQRMKCWPESSGTTTPLYIAKKNLFYLSQFRWLEPLRPLSPADVFDVSSDMLELMKEPPFGSRAGARGGYTDTPAGSSGPAVISDDEPTTDDDVVPEEGSEATESDSESTEETGEADETEQVIND